MNGRSLRPLRILHVIGQMNRGGAESMLMNLYRELQPLGVEFDFVTFSRAPGSFDHEIAALGGRVVYVPPPAQSGVVRSMRALKQVIHDGRYDAVHSHVLHGVAWTLLAAKWAGVPLRIAHSHSTADLGGSLQRRIYQTVSKLIIRSVSTQWIACGREAGRFLFGRRFDRCGLVLPNALQPEKFAFNQGTRRRVRRALGVGPDEILVGHVARFEPPKNHSFTFDMVQKTPRSGKISWQWVLVGDGSLRPALESHAEALGLVDSVNFLGVRSDVPELLNGFDVLVLPSHHEGLPVILVEAQANGLSCVVSEFVPREADLGLGMVEFLPLHAADWISAIGRRAGAGRPDPESVARALTLRGYDVATSAQKLLKVYEGVA